MNVCPHGTAGDYACPLCELAMAKARPKAVEFIESVPTKDIVEGGEAIQTLLDVARACKHAHPVDVPAFQAVAWCPLCGAMRSAESWQAPGWTVPAKRVAEFFESAGAARWSASAESAAKRDN